MGKRCSFGGGVVPAGTAAVLDEEERERGATVVDVGALERGATALAQGVARAASRDTRLE